MEHQDNPAHEMDHINRVRVNAIRIANYETKHNNAKINYTIINMAALLHDLDDYKITGSKQIGETTLARKFLEEHGFSKKETDTICEAIRTISFKADDSEKPKTIEGQIVQDADRLDAIGAIGIMRNFVYSAKKNQEIYNPAIEPKDHMTAKEYVNHKTTAINHWYEKLFRLENLMNTEAGRKVAQQRTEFMHTFLKVFMEEWRSTDIPTE
jgi:uncharacterized protein